jgi:predicted aminopeptidase
MPSINRRFAFRWILRAMAVLLGATVLSAFVPGCGVGYVVRSAYFQAELMTSRTPVEEVLASDRLSVEQRNRLLQVADIKRFGEDIGLKPTQNYDTIAIDWDRTIWNLTACQPLAFKPKTWRFPIVGKVPYLGFFRRDDADRWKERLETHGYEVYLRTAGISFNWRTQSFTNWYMPPCGSKVA